MAQVTISGNVDARYESLKTTAAAAAKGFAFSEAQVTFAATEDLGGGLKATARFTIDGATADSTGTYVAGDVPPTTIREVTGDGVFLSLAGGFGTVTFSSVDSADYLGNFRVTDQLGYNGSNQDRITYTSPTISGVRFTATMQDGDVGYQTTHLQKSNVFEIDYTAGPLTANIGMLSTDKTTNTSTDGFTRFKVGYNFGMAAVSYGQINAKDAAGVKDTVTNLNITVPLGAITLGYDYATSKDGALAKLDGTAITATYALSKRTSLTAQQVNFENATITNAKATRFTLAHAF